MITKTLSRILLLFVSMIIGVVANAQRTERRLDRGWRFTRGDNAAFASANYDDSKWEKITIPHDWAIFGPFSYDNDKQKVAISQDGQKEAMEHAGRTGGLPFVGVGWYRLTLSMPEYTKGKRVSLIFDGAMSQSKIFVNGKPAGSWIYGYNSFEVDITPYVIENQENTIAVRLENEEESSRWYPGAGLYRNVHLVVTEATHIPLWGVFITTQMGIMLMCESFDEWKTPKLSNGYHKWFDEWAEKDIVNLVRHYRNSPAVVMWCIGNEVPDQEVDNQGSKINKWLQDICHREDLNRPVTNGMDQPDAVVGNNFAAVLDVPGFNYRPFKYQTNYDKLPQRNILGSETASTVSSRGVYKFPVERASMRMYDDHQSSSYDVEHCGWSNLPEDDWIWQDDKQYCMGEFVWTGFDYLGEPTPYYSNWPSHSSLFGIIDLAGIPKDRFYLYRSKWAPEKETLHRLPHWTWPGREGKITPVYVYTNHPSAELFVNGESQGRIYKDTTISIEATANTEAEKALTRQRRYRLMWDSVKYVPGKISVVAYDKEGRKVATKEVSTAGKAERLQIDADTVPMHATGKDMLYITVSMVDKDGNLFPNADDLVNFSVSGNAVYRAAANGNSVSLDLFHEPRMHLFNGKLMMIVQSTDKTGSFTVQAKAKGVKSVSYTGKVLPIQ